MIFSAELFSHQIDIQMNFVCIKLIVTKCRSIEQRFFIFKYRQGTADFFGFGLNFIHIVKEIDSRHTGFEYPAVIRTERFFENIRHFIRTYRYMVKAAVYFYKTSVCAVRPVFNCFVSEAEILYRSVSVPDLNAFYCRPEITGSENDMIVIDKNIPGCCQMIYPSYKRKGTAVSIICNVFLADSLKLFFAAGFF